jgi:hypothetical protein
MNMQHELESGRSLLQSVTFLCAAMSTARWMRASDVCSCSAAVVTTCQSTLQSSRPLFSLRCQPRHEVHSLTQHAARRQAAPLTTRTSDDHRRLGAATGLEEHLLHRLPAPAVSGVINNSDAFCRAVRQGGVFLCDNLRHPERQPSSGMPGSAYASEAVHSHSLVLRLSLLSLCRLGLVQPRFLCTHFRGPAQPHCVRTRGTS